MKKYRVSLSILDSTKGDLEGRDIEELVSAVDSKAAVEEFLMGVVLSENESIHFIHVGPGKSIPPTSPIGAM